ncbi:MAG TPA: hypothetical protein VGB79_06295 [Allosphingosinicella sp.]|jgi:hypothetical protein
MFRLLLAVAAYPTVPTVPITPIDLATRFAREFCVAGADRLVRIRAWNLPGWNAGTPVTRLGITYGRDAPVPEHDYHSLRHMGPVQGGGATIWSHTYDFKDEERIDDSSAMLWIYPENLIDQAAIERILGVELVPNGSLMEASRPVRTNSPGQEPTPTRPLTSWTQHYRASNSFGDTVTIEASRHWGEGEDRPTWVIKCGTYRPPIRP